ncbi:MAG: class I SAM-dependent methyltransferase [Pseudomonadota bacterium]
MSGIGAAWYGVLFVLAKSSSRLPWRNSGSGPAGKTEGGRRVLTVDFSRLALAPGSRVLDVGCGTGRHSWEAAKLPGVHVTAADRDPERLARARGMFVLMYMEGQWGGGPVGLVCVDAAALPFPGGHFDLVICSEVLEHLPDDRAAVAELARVLKPGGVLAVSVPRSLPERLCWKLYAGYPEMAEGHLRIYTPRALAKLFAGRGLSLSDGHLAHALHPPLWWLKCLAANLSPMESLAGAYEKFLAWHIRKQPALTALANRLLAPVLAKSVVLYFKKEEPDETEAVRKPHP